MNQPINIKAQPIQVDAPSGTYYLQFRYLRGLFTHKSGTEDPVYVCGMKFYTIGQAVELLSQSIQPLDRALLKGYTVAAAAYVSTSLEGLDYEVGVIPLLRHGVPTNLIRRLALTEAIANLSTADRAYFHLKLSVIEGRDTRIILRDALVSRAYPKHRQILIHHLKSQKGYWDDRDL